MSVALQISWRFFYSERIFLIGQYSTKLCVQHLGFTFFWPTLYIFGQIYWLLTDWLSSYAYMACLIIVGSHRYILDSSQTAILSPDWYAIMQRLTGWLIDSFIDTTRHNKRRCVKYSKRSNKKETDIKEQNRYNNSNVRSRCGSGNAYFISVRHVSLLVDFPYFATY